MSKQYVELITSAMRKRIEAMELKSRAEILEAEADQMQARAEFDEMLEWRRAICGAPAGTCGSGSHVVQQAQPATPDTSAQQAVR